ncbi:MAG: prepilin-type N-terminal cleavage/methylation domain-containing protein (plasmid) [Candidatus Manganitrophus sp.]|nr:MAG: prepilin-type N-terminal cleavage/methylation domain-containing protein [Candidatus Manganitrophus sp.]
MQNQHGITLVEVLVGIGILALILFMVSPVFLVKAESHRRVIEGSIPALIGESLKDAILVGARENYNPVENTIFFDFEGVRIRIRSLAPGERIHLPFDAVPRQGLYPLGLVYSASDHMVVNGVDLGPLTDGTGNVIRGVVGPPVDEDRNGNRFLDSGEDLNGSGLLDTMEDVNNNGALDLGEDTNGNCILDAGEDNNGNGVLDGSEDLNCNRFLDAPDLFLNEDANRNGRLDPGEDVNGNGVLNVPQGSPVATGDPLVGKPNPYLPYRADFYRNYGYTLEIVRPSISPRYEFTVRIFPRFFDVRAGFQSAPYPVLKAYSEPEVGTWATNCNDDDEDGIVDDQPVFNDKPAGTSSSPCGLHDWRGTPETLLNGIDDDGDGVIDDGVILPSREMKFTIDF